ncbi:MAG: class I SAM-dependent methyltransferase [Acidimicrobiales bacterium]|nr:class I SAM-dependent methyltransferase [Acidimicrobiales bacterium]
MDLDDPHALQRFLEVYGTLPRAGPGGDEHTTRALALVPGPTPRSVLDLGCGPGAQTVCLARSLPEAEILALDLLVDMVDEANRRLVDAGLEGRAHAEVGDMARPPVVPGGQDLIWCEGAIYNLGVTEALRGWRPLLAPGGTVAFTEPVWLTEAPPDEIRDWWSSEYPAMTDDTGIRSRIDEAGYRSVAMFTLPPSAWWDEYYEPMQGRVDALRARAPDDAAAAEVVRSAATEIDAFRRFGDHYSYAFYVVRPLR